MAVLVLSLTVAVMLALPVVHSRPAGVGNQLLDCLLGDRSCYHGNRDKVLEVLAKLLKDDAPADRKRTKSVTPRTIYFNAVIYTVAGADWDYYPEDSMVVEGEMILFVGTEVGAEAWHRAGDTWVNLHGATVLPGIHDVHQHPLEAKTDAGAACEFAETDGIQAIGATIVSSRCWEQQLGTDPWVLGWGHSIYKVLELLDDPSAPSPRQILDQALPDRPLILMEATSHSVLVNSKALELAGITATSPPIPGGVVWKDASGEPNGILLENAGNVIMSMAMAETAMLNGYHYDGLKSALKYLNELGITSVCDARAYWRQGHDKLWEKLLQQEPNLFTVRAVLGLWASPEADDADQIAKLKAHYSNNPDSLLRKSQIKFYSDGLLQTTTAAMLEPYTVDYHLQGMEGNMGINYFNQDRLASYMSELQDLGGGEGFDFHVHAIGDRGIREVLNAVEQTQAGGATARHRITHVETVSPADVPKFKQLNVIADFQVAGDFTLPKHIPEVAELIGQTKAKFMIPVANVSDTGAKVTLSSDWDVSSPNPFQGIHHALIRGDQSVDVKTAVEMYTINGAYVMRQEDKVGSLVAGKEADFIAIDTDILLPFNKPYIPYTRVLRTVLKGRTVFQF